MPKILPIRDLKNTTKISALCHQTNEPIFITKNGYGDMVIMSMETYEEAKYLKEVIGKIEEGEEDIQEGRVIDAKEAISFLKEKYEL